MNEYGGLIFFIGFLIFLFVVLPIFASKNHKKMKKHRENGYKGVFGLDGNPIIPKEIKISEKEREKLSIEMNEEIDRELFIKGKEISFSSEEEYLLWKKNKEEEEKDGERFRKVLKVIGIVGGFALLVRGISSSRGVEINPIGMVIFFIIVLVFAIFSQY